MGGVHPQPKQCAGFPAHRLKIPPQVPLANRRGRSWGERGGTTGARAALPNASSGGTASRPMCQLVWRSGCSEDARPLTSSGAPAADVPSSAATGAAVEPLRASLSNPAFSGPAAGMAGDRGGDLAGAAQSGAQRNDLQAGQFAKRASFTRSGKESGPARPGHGKGRRAYQPAPPA